MRLLWSARLDIATATLADALEILASWIRSPTRAPAFEGPLRPGDFDLCTGGLLQVDQSPEEGEPTSWALRYERAVAEQGLAWITEVAFERRDESFAGLGRLSQRSMSAARPRFERVDLRPPRFALDFRQRGLLGPAAFVVRSVGPEDVGSFVETVIDGQRVYPIVAISVDAYRERPLLDPSTLQNELIGIAQVVLVKKDASFLLPHEFETRGVLRRMSRIWSVYGGAVQVYRAQARTTETPFDHPIWLPAEVSEPGYAATLKDWCWSLAALDPPHLTTDVASIRAARRLAIVTVSAEATNRTLGEVTELYESALTDEEARTAEERRRGEAEKARADELSDRVRQLEAKVQSLQYLLRHKGDTAPPGEEQPAPTDFEDVAAALAQARTDFGETLVIPADLAVETSEEPAFWYGALHALHRLCELERKGEARNKRELLRDLLAKHVEVSKDTYKVADTGITIPDPLNSKRMIAVRERVHLREGKPHETESIYWHTFGNDPGVVQVPHSPARTPRVAASGPSGERSRPVPPRPRARRVAARPRRCRDPSSGCARPRRG